jgi:heme/copper-type cytochrome/quinol oxidase subunit 1
VIDLSLVIGEFARTGWLAYPPFSELPADLRLPVAVGKRLETHSTTVR